MEIALIFISAWVIGWLFVDYCKRSKKPEPPQDRCPNPVEDGPTPCPEDCSKCERRDV